MPLSRLKLVVEVGLKYTKKFQKHFCKLCVTTSHFGLPICLWTYAFFIFKGKFDPKMLKFLKKSPNFQNYKTEKRKTKQTNKQIVFFFSNLK